MTVKCEFYNYGDGYRCNIINKQEIPSEVSAETIQGVHEVNHTNDDVRVLRFENSKVERIPDGIGEVFKNVTDLLINNSNLKEISKQNLRQFPNLEKLNLNCNQLEYLPGDLFEFNKKLEWIWLSSNKIKFIGPELLDGLEVHSNLTYVNLENNQNINRCYLKNGSRYNLYQLKKEIKFKCKPPPELLLEQKINQRGPNQNICDRLKDLDKFLTLDDFKDFTIKVGSKDFKVHKMIFMARSPTFAEMIKNNPDADELVLTDIPVEVFESILHFVYTDQPPKDTRNVREIFAAAGKLKIKSLMEILAKIMIKEMENEKNLDFLLENFNLGLKFECEKLKLKAFEGIKRKFTGIDLKDDLLERPEKLRKIVKTKILLDKQIAEDDEDEAAGGEEI